MGPSTDPHFAARQFGLVLFVPCPIMYTSNNQFILRDQINEELFGSFEFVPFELSCLVTKDFHTWWSGYAAKVFHKPVTEVLEGREESQSKWEEGVKSAYDLEGTEKSKSYFFCESHCL